MTTAIYAGSFDPFHLGHLSTIRASAERFGRLYVVVAANPGKPVGLFDAEKRRELLAAATAQLAGVSVVAHSGLVVEAASLVCADVLVRSAGKERAAETSMAYLNLRGADIPTVLVAPDPTTAHISSTAIRDLVARGAIDAARDLVPPVVAAALTPATAVSR